MQPKARTSFSVLLLLLIAAASVVFLLRGPLRVSSRSIDLAAPYVGSLRWVRGQDPYASGSFLQDWAAAGAHDTGHLDKSGRRPIYPPSTFPVLAPLTLLPWNAALRLLAWTCSAAYLLLLYRLALRIENSWQSRRRLAFVVAGLLLSPIHTGLFTGNVSILAFLLCAFAALASFAQLPVAAGLLLALGCCIKPTAGYSIVLFLLLCRQWRACAACFTAGLAIAGVGFWRLAHINPVWQQHYRENLAYLFGPLGVATFLPVNVSRYQILSLEVPFTSLLHSVRLATVLAWAVTASLFAAWGVLHFERVQRRLPLQTWTSFSVLAMLSLLPIYQRFYSAGVVLFALCAALQFFRLRAAKCIALLSVWFLLPAEEILRRSLEPHFPAAFTHGPVWLAGILPLNSWIVLAISVALLFVMREENRRFLPIYESVPVATALAGEGSRQPVREPRPSPAPR